MCTITMTDVAKGQGVAVLSLGLLLPCSLVLPKQHHLLLPSHSARLSEELLQPRDRKEKEEAHTVASQGDGHEDTSSPSPASCEALCSYALHSWSHNAFSSRSRDPSAASKLHLCVAPALSQLCCALLSNHKGC